MQLVLKAVKCAIGKSKVIGEHEYPATLALTRVLSFKKHLASVSLQIGPINVLALVRQQFTTSFHFDLNIT
jgi:hypothetical protein